MELDKRYKHSLRLTSPFYLYVKHKRSGIFYVRYKDGKTVSTGSKDINAAYQFALKNKQSTAKEKYSTEIIKNYFIKDSTYLKYDELHGSIYSDRVLKQNKFACDKMYSLLSDLKSITELTKSRLHKLQEQLIDSGLSGKSVNNYLAILHKIIKQLVDKEIIETDPFIGLRNCNHEKEARSCYPIKLLKSINWKQNKYTMLAYASASTGMRRSELMSYQNGDITIKDGIKILHVKGTKNQYSDRYVPVTDLCEELLNEIYNNSYATDSNIRDVSKIIGEIINYHTDEIITFHGFRKTYKTVLTSANLNTTLIETLMGHSVNNQKSNNVERIYFVEDKADLTAVYQNVLNALSSLL